MTKQITRIVLMKWILIIIVASLTLLLFIGSPDNYDSRIIKQIWESGHFALFACLVFITLQIGQLKKLPLFLLFLAVTVFSGGVGLLTEVIQSLVGRSFEIKDLVNDLLGGYAGLLTTQLSRNKTKLVNLSVLIGISIFTTLGLRSLIIATIDQWHTEKNFPILSDFETRFQIGRWDYHLAKLSNSKQHKRAGEFSMKVDFSPGKYPSISLIHLKRDWRNYNNIHFSLYNTAKLPIELNLKIYDVTHPLRGYHFDDRFNHEFFIQPGWNDFSFSLKNIKQSPQERDMEMRAILSLSLFMVDLKEPVTIYVDDVLLNQQ
jgi:VanZ family protein